jgi:hypothetical protein
MRSFASVAVSLDGTEHGRFQAVSPRVRWFAQVVPAAGCQGLVSRVG